MHRGHRAKCQQVTSASRGAPLDICEEGGGGQKKYGKNGFCHKCRIKTFGENDGRKQFVDGIGEKYVEQNKPANGMPQISPHQISKAAFLITDDLGVSQLTQDIRPMLA